MATMYSVNCMMCGRSSGQIRNGVFYRAPAAPPLELRNGQSRCGFCSGSVYLEADDSMSTPIPIERPRARLLAS